MLTASYIANALSAADRSQRPAALRFAFVRADLAASGWRVGAMRGRSICVRAMHAEAGRQLKN